MKIPRFVPPAAAALFGLASFALGLFIADPLAAVRQGQELRLRAIDAREEFFSAPDGTKLRTWVAGPVTSPVPVVLLHGLGASGDYWAGTAKELRASGRTVYLPDAPGSGGSEPPRDPSGYGVANRVAAIDALVNTMAFDRIDLVGHSLGGWAAARYALTHPEKIRKLVLVDAGGFSPRPHPEGEAAMKESVSPRSREGGRRLVDLLFAHKPFPVVGFVSDGFARNYHQENVTKTLDALRPEDWVIEEAHNLPRGTIVIWGSEETLFPLAGARPNIARIPDVQFFVLDGAGHDGPLESPAVFNEKLVSFLSLSKTEATPKKQSYD